VLEGSVRREGDAVRLTLQLIDARSDQHIWAEDFDRTLTNSLTLQSEVAGEVASKLSTKLSGVPKEGATVTKDPVAYDIYLKARIARQLLAGYSSIAEWQNVATLLDQAIAKDPGFALAYVARFDVYFWLFTANYDATPKTLEHARADLAAAEKLAPNDAAVLGAKAQWAFIEQDYSRALDLYAKAEAAGLSDPNLLIWKNITLAYVGRFDEGIAVLERAVALDPANVNLLAIWGATLMGALRPAEGLKAIDLAIARVPNAMPLRAFRENARYAFTGDSRNWDKLVETEVRPTVTQTGADDGPTIAGVVDWLLVKGRYAEARQLIDDAPYDAVRLSLAPPGAMYGVPYTPTALFRGQCDLLLGDMTAASKDGAALLAYVGHQDETNWNKWFLRELAAAGQLLQGNKSRAINLVHEALAAAPYPHGPAEPGVVEAQTVWILAWAGAQDEAMNTLERLATTAPGLPPASIAQAPIYTVPLAANTRFQALKAKLETQMAATKLE
jgi:tetratricopeptide (TPR) repeat protein